MLIQLTHSSFIGYRVGLKASNPSTRHKIRLSDKDAEKLIIQVFHPTNYSVNASTITPHDLEATINITDVLSPRMADHFWSLSVSDRIEV